MHHAVVGIPEEAVLLLLLAEPRELTGQIVVVLAVGIQLRRSDIESQHTGIVVHARCSGERCSGIDVGKSLLLIAKKIFQPSLRHLP